MCLTYLFLQSYDFLPHTLRLLTSTARLDHSLTAHPSCGRHVALAFTGVNSPELSVDAVNCVAFNALLCYFLEANMYIGIRFLWFSSSP